MSESVMWNVSNIISLYERVVIYFCQRTAATNWSDCSCSAPKRGNSQMGICLKRKRWPATQWYHSGILPLTSSPRQTERKECTHARANSAKCPLHLWQPKAYTCPEGGRTFLSLLFPPSQNLNWRAKWSDILIFKGCSSKMEEVSCSDSVRKVFKKHKRTCWVILL